MWHFFYCKIVSMMNTCSYVYFSQPPSNISCDIYDIDRIILECSAISLESANYTLKWYHEGRIVMNASISNFASIIQAPGQRTHFQLSRLGLEQLDIIPGYYYCQIELTDNATSMDIEFEPSNMVYLREEEFYQNKTMCVNNIFKTEDDKVACTITTTGTSASTVEITGSLNVTISYDSFPVWGYIVGPIAVFIILMSILVLISLSSLCGYIKHRQTTDQKRETLATHCTEEQSEQTSTSTSTDHTYEELDIYMTGVEQRQQHIPISVCDLDLETELSNDINQGSYDTLLSADVTLKNQPSYDRLDPQTDSNLSYEISTQDFVVIGNKAYNKRNEFDPQTSACLAYMYSVHPQAQH